MPLIHHHILHRPFHPSLKHMFPIRTILLHAQRARIRHTGVNVDEQLHRVFPIVVDQSLQRLHFLVRFAGSEVPGHRHVAVDV